MKNVMKKMFMFTSILGVAVLLAGCMGCPNKRNARHTPKPQPVTDTVVFYQTYEDADITRVHAKMYTHSSNGGESKMGYIRFSETDAGLKMEVDLKDLRPGVPYTVKINQCSSCGNNSTCCDKASVPMTLPTLKVSRAGRLEESFIIRGLRASQLNNAKIYLERDGGYKAAWGTLEQNMLF